MGVPKGKMIAFRIDQNLIDEVRKIKERLEDQLQCKVTLASLIERLIRIGIEHETIGKS